MIDVRDDREISDVLLVQEFGSDRSIDYKARAPVHRRAIRPSVTPNLALPDGCGIGIEDEVRVGGIRRARRPRRLRAPTDRVPSRRSQSRRGNAGHRRRSRSIPRAVRARRPERCPRRYAEHPFRTPGTQQSDDFGRANRTTHEDPCIRRRRFQFRERSGHRNVTLAIEDQPHGAPSAIVREQNHRLCKVAVRQDRGLRSTACRLPVRERSQASAVCQDAQDAPCRRGCGRRPSRP